MKGENIPPRARAILLVALYFALYFGSTYLERPLARLLMPWVRDLLPAAQPGQVPPALLLVLCVVRIVLIVAVTLLIARLDGRRLRDYGWRPFPLRQFATGAGVGLAAVSVVVLALYLGGELRFAGWNVVAWPALGYGMVWALGMLLVGVSEEMQFRGAPVLLLMRAAPAWVAVAVSAAAFGAVHLGNDGENAWGIAQVMLFGAVAALSVVRTGSLAWAIGLHASWNWTLEYLYGAVGSGYTFQGHLLRTEVAGPAWLTGGSSGLEGSVWSYMVLLVVGMAWLCVLHKKSARGQG